MSENKITSWDNLKQIVEKNIAKHKKDQKEIVSKHIESQIFKEFDKASSLGSNYIIIKHSKSRIPTTIIDELKKLGCMITSSEYDVPSGDGLMTQATKITLPINGNNAERTSLEYGTYLHNKKCDDLKKLEIMEKLNDSEKVLEIYNILNSVSVFDEIPIIKSKSGIEQMSLFQQTNVVPKMTLGQQSANVQPKPLVFGNQSTVSSEIQTKKRKMEETSELINSETEKSILSATALERRNKRQKELEERAKLSGKKVIESIN